MASAGGSEGGPVSMVPADESEAAMCPWSDSGASNSVAETTLESTLEVPSISTASESTSSVEEASDSTVATTSTASSSESTSSPASEAVSASAASSEATSHPSAREPPTASMENSSEAGASKKNIDDDTSDESFVVRDTKGGVVVIDREGVTSTEGEEEEDQSVYQIKWTKFHSESAVAIVTQNENGPCPLLAIVNVLLLRGKLKINSGTAIITYSQLMALLWDCILTQTPQHISAGDRLNYEKNMNDALAVIHKLQTGLDVNVKFTGVADFEYTIESIIFDLLNISLYHGWLMDPQSPETEAALGSYSYNQIVERIISNKASPRPELVTEALIAEEFLENTKSQLTYHGICELHNKLEKGELAVFFRNNHFSTIYKLKEELFLLVTDQGFVTEPNVMWETLANVEGDSHFVDQDFKTYSAPSASSLVHSSPSAAASSPIAATAAAAAATVVTGEEEQKQIDADLLVALSMQDELDKAVAAAAAAPTSSQPSEPAAEGSLDDSQELADHQLAMALQQEEERQLEAARQSRDDAGTGSSGTGGGGAEAGASSISSGGGTAAAGSERRSNPHSSPGGDRDGGNQPRRSPGQEKDKEKDCVIL